MTAKQQSKLEVFLIIGQCTAAQVAQEQALMIAWGPPVLVCPGLRGFLSELKPEKPRQTEKTRHLSTVIPLYIAVSWRQMSKYLDLCQRMSI